jgi:hypothetical protein
MKARIAARGAALGLLLGLFLSALFLLGKVGPTRAQEPGPGTPVLPPTITPCPPQEEVCGIVPIPGPGATPGPGPIPGPGPGPRPQPTPPPCPNPTEIIVSGPHYDEDRNRCFVIVQVIDLCINTPMGDPLTRYVECPKPTTSNPCVDSSGNPLFSRDLSPLRPVLVAGDWGRPAMRRAPDLVRGRGPQGT